MAKNDYFYGLGRRKSATARARVFKGKGNVTINDRPALDFLCGNTALLAETVQPLSLVGKANDFDVSLKVTGGGTAGQVDASKLAIAKALSAMNDDLKSSLRKADLLKRDPREKERKKYGLRSARKKEQFSKR